VQLTNQLVNILQGSDNHKIPGFNYKLNILKYSLILISHVINFDNKMINKAKLQNCTSNFICLFKEVFENKFFKYQETDENISKVLE